MKNNIDFNNGYQLTINNARELFEAAEQIAIKKNFGLAISLLVLSSEEAIKAFMLKARNNFTEEEIYDYKKYFIDHKYKFKMIQSIVLLVKVNRTIYQMMYKEIFENPNKSIEEKQEMLNKGTVQSIEWMQNEVKGSKTELSIELEWWNHAKNLKEDGFYVKENNKVWNTPRDLSRPLFVQSKKYVEDFIESVELLGEIDFNKEPIKSLFLEMKKQYFSYKN